MDEGKDVKDVLEEIKGIFPNVGKECVDSLSFHPSTVLEPWSVVPRLQGRFDHIFSIGNGNALFQAIMVVGIQSSSINAFFDIGTDGDDLLLDVFGEVANQFCGLLMDSKIFTGTFGILTQSVPQYSVNQTFFPRVWGVDGRLYQNDAWMYFGYAVRSSR